VRDAEGYFLKIGRETKRIEVEDTAYFVIRIDGSAASGFELLLNDETRERLDPETLKYRPGRLVCAIKKGPNRSEEEAKFLHAPYFELLSLLEEDGKSYFLTLGGRRFALASKAP
jgi:hypothetical protein